MCGMGVEYILKNSLLRRSLDNVTVVVIGFSNFKHSVFGYQQNTKSGREEKSAEPALELKPEVKPTFIEQTRIIERTRSANLPKYHPPSKEKPIITG